MRARPTSRPCSCTQPAIDSAASYWSAALGRLREADCARSALRPTTGESTGETSTNYRGNHRGKNSITNYRGIYRGIYRGDLHKLPGQCSESVVFAFKNYRASRPADPRTNSLPGNLPGDINQPPGNLPGNLPGGCSELPGVAGKVFLLSDASCCYADYSGRNGTATNYRASAKCVVVVVVVLKNNNHPKQTLSTTTIFMTLVRDLTSSPA
jgi:hypothetical protein